MHGPRIRWQAWLALQTISSKDSLRVAAMQCGGACIRRGGWERRGSALCAELRKASPELRDDDEDCPTASAVRRTAANGRDRPSRGIRVCPQFYPILPVWRLAMDSAPDAGCLPAPWGGYGTGGVATCAMGGRLSSVERHFQGQESRPVRPSERGTHRPARVVHQDASRRSAGGGHDDAIRLHIHIPAVAGWR